MKKTTILAAVSVILLSGCAKTAYIGTNDANKRYFDAWLQMNHPELVGQQQFPGFYVVKETEGTGQLISLPDVTPYVRANYRATDLDGNLLDYTYEQDAYKMRSYSYVTYYGPQVFDRADNALYAGLDYALRDMRVGGTREVIIPGWLFSTNRYETAQEYIDNVSGTDAIYSLEVTEAISDITQWEQDSVLRYVLNKYPYSESDTTGFYKYTLKKPEMTFEDDTTVYINYIGRRLDGKVFDTNIADTAKFYDIWSSEGTYEPMLVNWKKTYSEITVTSSSTSVITGFSLLLNKMGAKEKAIGIFNSNYGYSSSGSGVTIPPYCPLEFEVELVEESE